MSKTIYGLSRSRDKHGNIVKRTLMNWTNCVHASVNGGTESRQVLVVEVEDEQTSDKTDVGVSQQGRERNVDD